jgi:hypothetical protein
MNYNFDKYIYKVFLEQPENNAPDENQQNDVAEQEPQDVGQQEPQVFPEELELAKLAIRAIYFNISSKGVHKLKLKYKGRIIPFEKISDFFEKTKKIFPVLGFVEWAMDRYEGFSSKWTEQPEIKGDSIITKIKKFNKNLPEENRLDNGKRVYWTRIILNCLLHGTTNFNINISDVNEQNIKEIFRLLKQHFGSDTRGMFAGEGDWKGPGTF